MKIARSKGIYRVSGGTEVDGTYRDEDFRPVLAAIEAEDHKLPFISQMVRAFELLRMAGNYTPPPKRRKSGHFARKRKGGRRG